MTANERLAEIKAQLAEVEVAWELSLSEIDEVSDTLRSLVAALEAVLELHQPREIQVMTEDDCLSDECGHPDMDDCPVGPLDRCAGCVGYMAYPCFTVMIINEALGGTK